MVAAVDPGTAVSLGSAVAVGLLGLAVALSGSRRASTLSFSAFLVVWSGLLVSGNLSRIAAMSGDLAGARTWLLVLSAFLVVIYLPLVHFADSFPTERGWLVRSTAGSALLLAPAVAGAGVLLLEPELFHRGFREIGGSMQSDWGPLFVAYQTLFIGAFYLLLWRLVEQYTGAEVEIERLRARDLLLALGLFLAFQASKVGGLSGWSIVSGEALAQDAAFVVLYGVGLVLLAWAGLAVARRDRRGTRLVVGAFVVPALFGFLAGLGAAIPTIPSLQTRGLWRLVTVAVIAYAVLRYEMFDVDVRAARGTAVAGAFAATVAAGFGVSRAVEAALGSPALGNLAGIAVAGGIVLALSYSRPGFLVTLEGRLGASGRLDRRRLEVYEAAVVRDRAREDPTLGRTLDRLREDLDLTEAEADLLERHVAGARIGGQAPEPGPGTVVGDRYALEAPAGEGRSGRAWRARDRREDEAVVLKILDRPLSDRDAVYGFLRETRAARRVSHPNVVGLRDVGLLGTHPYLVLDHVAGGSLDAVLEKEGRVDPEAAVAVVDDVLSGLEALHDAGLVHRDVKSANVLLTEDGRAVLADLDLAGPVDPDATVTGLGDVGRAGTPATMSPEVAAGEDASPRSDVYAAGALLHLLLAGEPYVDLSGVRPGNLPARIRSADPRPLPDDVPPDLAAVARKALSAAPGDRYPSAEAMRAALRAAA